ncbi:MAG TPA: hypothetical protein PKJ26_04950, partial [Candidatus Woesebacteria bacterium]|nr:hypothetical protein [Candidatus Woesebacteria bacterium]
MNKRVRRFLLQVFSSLNALFLTFQPLAALPVLLANPVVVQAEASVSADAVDLTFDAGSHEFQLRVKTDQALPYVLTYLDEKQDPQVEQAAQGNLEKMDEGVFGADVYAGTCSGEVCTPITFLRGTLAVGESFKNSFQLINDVIVFDGSDTTVEQVCVNLDEVGMTAGDTLWSVDETTGVAETKTKVQPGVSYQFPLDDAVSVTFSCLPKDESLRSPLKIQQVLVSELSLPDSIKTSAEYAYDITTEMENGTFEYELTLPKAEGVEAEVVYLEKTLEEVKTSVLPEEVITIEETEDVVVEQELGSDEIILSGLEHFSIYLTTYTNYTVGSSGVTNPNYAWTSNDQYAVFDTDGDWAEYRFDNLPILSAGDTIDGIKITFEGNTTVTSAYFDVAVYNKSSNSYSTSKASSLFGITPPDSSAMFAGGSNDKWGKSWASSDFSSNNFKIKITKKFSGTINLDRVWVEIYYTPTPTPVACTEGNAWASEVGDAQQGTLKNDDPITDITRTNPASTLGTNDGQFFSLGYGGSIIVAFPGYIVDAPNAPDLSFHEVTNGRLSYPVEKAGVAVSQDGINWTQLGEVTNK